MRRSISILFATIAAGLLSVAAHAAPVTIDFEAFNLGDAPVGSFGVYDPLVSQGYEFNGGNGPCGQYGCPPEIINGQSGSKSFGALNGWGGQDGFGAQVFVTIERVGGGAFAIHSLDLVLAGCAGGGPSCGGGESITGTLAGGGAANLAVPVGTGDWLNLEFVQFSAFGDGFGFGTGTVVELDNISVSAVPVPAAVWLFGSALAGLGWLRRKRDV